MRVLQLSVLVVLLLAVCCAAHAQHTLPFTPLPTQNGLRVSNSKSTLLFDGETFTHIGFKNKSGWESVNLANLQSKLDKVRDITTNEVSLFLPNRTPQSNKFVVVKLTAPATLKFPFEITDAPTGGVQLSGAISDPRFTPGSNFTYVGKPGTPTSPVGLGGVKVANSQQLLTKAIGLADAGKKVAIYRISPTPAMWLEVTLVPVAPKQGPLASKLGTLAYVPGRGMKVIAPAVGSVLRTGDFIVIVSKPNNAAGVVLNVDVADVRNIGTLTKFEAALNQLLRVKNGVSTVAVKFERPGVPLQLQDSFVEITR